MRRGGLRLTDSVAHKKRVAQWAAWKRCCDQEARGEALQHGDEMDDCVDDEDRTGRYRNS